MPKWCLIFLKISFTLILLLAFAILDISMVKICREYFDSGSLTLSSFNSVFEISVGFGFAYGAIEKFRAKAKERVYNSVNNVLAARKNALFDILGFDKVIGWIKHWVAKFIANLGSRIEIEVKNTENQTEHRIQDCLLYFSFFAILCIVCAGLLDGQIQDGKLHELQLRVYIFLTIFGCISYLTAEIRYHYFVNPDLEWTIGLFSATFFVSYTISVYCSTFWLGDLMHPFCFGELHVHEHNPPFKFYNYVIVGIVTLHAYPYFLYFRKFYFWSFLYLSCSFVLIALHKSIDTFRTTFTFIKNLIQEIWTQKLSQIFKNLLVFPRHLKNLLAAILANVKRKK